VIKNTVLTEKQAKKTDYKPDKQGYKIDSISQTKARSVKQR
jgi:hypothetical protein